MDRKVPRTCLRMAVAISATAGLAGLSSAPTSRAANFQPQEIPVGGLFASVPLQAHPIVAPEKGCLKIIYTAPVINAETGAVEGHGTGFALACDEASAPSEAASRTIFASMASFNAYPGKEIYAQVLVP